MITKLRFRHFSASCLALVFTLVLSQCQPWQRAYSKDLLKTPDIQLRDISLVNLNFAQAQLLVDLKVHNKNKVDIVVKSIFYRLKLNNTQVNQGRIQQRERFVALTARSVKVPVTLAYDQDLAKILDALSGPASPDYEISGSVKLEGYQEPLPFNHKDRLQLCPGC